MPETAVEQPQEVDAAAIWNEELLARAVAATNGAPETETPAGDTDPEQDPAQVAAAASGGTPATQLPPELAAMAEQVGSLKELVGQLTNQLSTTVGRVGALQSTLEASRKAADAVNRAPNEQAVKAAFKTPEKWEALKKDFPDWAEAMESFVDAKQAAERTAAVGASQLEELRGQVQNAIQSLTGQFGQALEEVRLFAVHPDWAQTVKTPEFQKWLAEAPQATKDVFYKSKSANESIDVLNRFKAAARNATRDVGAERAAKLRAAATTRRGSAPAPAVSDANLTPEQIWAQEAARMAQRRAANA